LAADLSHRMGWLGEADVTRIHAIFEAANLPTRPPALGVERYLDLMGMDKKVEEGKIRFVLQQAIGKSILTSEYDSEALQKTLASIDG
jgi:3-dehydroquinate synthase